MVAKTVPKKAQSRAEIDKVLQWLAGRVLVAQMSISDDEPELQLMLSQWIDFLRSICEAPE